MTKPYEKFYMEHSEGSGNKPPPHSTRIEISTGPRIQKGWAILQTNTSSGSGPEQRINMYPFEEISGKRYNTKTGELIKSASYQNPDPLMKKTSGKNLNSFRSQRQALRPSGLNWHYDYWFRVDSSGTGSSTEGPQIPETSVPSLIRSLESGRPDNFRRRMEGNRKGRDI